MHGYRQLALAACAALAMLALLAHAAAAANGIALDIDGRGGRGPIAFTGSLQFHGETMVITCNVTLRGELTTLTIEPATGRRLPEGLIANITDFRPAEVCSTNIIGLTATMRSLIPEAIRVRYNQFTEELPKFKALEVSLLLTRFLIEISSLALSCLYRGGPAALLAESNERRSFDSLTITRGAISFGSGSGLCPMSGTVSASFSVSPAIKARLEPPPPYVVGLGDSMMAAVGGRWAGNVATANGESRMDALGVAPGGCGEQPQAAEDLIGGGIEGLDLACDGDTASGFNTAILATEAEELEGIKLVVVGLGANDFAVREVAIACTEAYNSTGPVCSTRREVTETISAAEIATHKRDLLEAIVAIRETMREKGYEDRSYSILVQNYPAILPSEGRLFRYEETEPRARRRRTVGACEFWDADAVWINREELPAINRAIAEAAREAATRFANILQLDVSTAFERRALCERSVGTIEEARLASWRAAGASDLTEWVGANHYETAISLPETTVEESLHPSYWGELALRNCIRKAYNSGTPRGGRCVRDPLGRLDAQGEPNMRLE